MFSRILVPVDLDNVEKLTRALSLAGETAKGSSVEVVYVDVIDAVPTTSLVPEGERVADRLRHFALEQANQHGINTSGEIALRSDLRFNVGPDIVRTVGENDCNLIVSSSHVSGFKDHISSSNAGYVASKAPIGGHVER